MEVTATATFLHWSFGALCSNRLAAIIAGNLLATIDGFAAHISRNCAFAVIDYYCFQNGVECASFAWDLGSSLAVVVVTTAVVVAAASLVATGVVVTNCCAIYGY